MLNIKEIALKVGLQAFEEHPYDKGHVVSPSGYTWIDDKLIEFAEALIAEIAKQNEPVAWARYPKFTGSTQRQEIVFKKPDDLHNWVCLYTIPPTAEQIANETAEACARYVNRFINGDGILNEVWISEIEEALRNGAWKDFKK